MTAFADLLAIQDDVHDGLLGEEFLISPVEEQAGDVNARRVISEIQPATLFTGIWDEMRVDQPPHNAAGHGDGVTRRLNANRLTIDYQLASIPFRVTKGHVVTRSADGCRYEVADVVPDGETRALMLLTAATKAFP